LQEIHHDARSHECQKECNKYRYIFPFFRNKFTFELHEVSRVGCTPNIRFLHVITSTYFVTRLCLILATFLPLILTILVRQMMWMMNDIMTDSIKNSQGIKYILRSGEDYIMRRFMTRTQHQTLFRRSNQEK